MSDDKKQDSQHEEDDRENKETESGDKKTPDSTDAVAPADDDIIIK
ncbi:MAG: hypothetical protein QOD33_138 [Pyrinomonadaceae bacterium]|nr:hypothetical protein [Pyrinomonadaceae bacterium]